MKNMIESVKTNHLKARYVRLQRYGKKLSQPNFQEIEPPMCGIISIFQKHFWKYEQVKAYIDRMQDMNECMIGKVKTSVDKREVFIQIYIYMYMYSIWEI